MAEGKWISGLTAATPLVEAARKTLGGRLQVVGDYLRLALQEPYRDMEHIHQLRVGTRRAVAALDIFASCLPRKMYRSARRQLRRLRRAAGEARDWDVFRATLEGRRTPHRRGADFLLGYALGQRLAAQAHLQQANFEPPFRFEHFQAEILEAVRLPDADTGAQTLLDLARPILLDLLKQLHDAATSDLKDYEHLHQVRIIGKRLRYAMEVFADCFAAPFRETIYPAVEEMQEILGRANDSQQASRRLTLLRDYLRQARPSDWKIFRPDIEGLLRYHQRRLPRERRNFQQWWKRWQASRAEAEWVTLLKSPVSTS